jgi:hypothetical protein
VTPALRARFTGFVKKRALTELASLRSLLNPVEFHEVEKKILTQLASGSANWGPKSMGALAQEFYLSDEGQVYLLQLLLEKQHGPVTEEVVLQLYEENPEGLKAALRASYNLPPRDEAPADPNAAAPVMSLPGTTRTTM